MNIFNAATAWVIFVIILALVLCVGWAINIITVFHSDIYHPTAMLIIRFIGIAVFPLGGILGYF